MLIVLFDFKLLFLSTGLRLSLHNNLYSRNFAIFNMLHHPAPVYPISNIGIPDFSGSNRSIRNQQNPASPSNKLNGRSGCRENFSPFRPWFLRILSARQPKVCAVRSHSSAASAGAFARLQQR